jgi:hypothetical protein
VWASLLPLADARGHIDMSFPAISTMTGWPLELLRQGIEELEKPDPDSRSQAEEGRRLVRLDPARSWGWRLVNHSLYRERARDKQRTEDGRNATKVRNWREKQKEPVTECNPALPVVTSGTLSDSDTDTNKNKDTSSSSTGEVFEHWRRVFKKGRCVLDPKRTKFIRVALKNYSVDELKRCIDGYRKSDWHAGKNETGKVYDEISLFLRDAEHIERGISIQNGTGRKDPYAHAQ